LQPTDPVQNVPSRTPYATVEELAIILQIRDYEPRRVALQRVLDTASGEIDIELGRSVPLSGWELALASEVCLERAVEHWHQSRSPFGVLGLGLESGPILTARDSWDRHANKLAALKDAWGIA